jgi:pimeloyl-ACP methyl ester carboxylesterase
MTELVESSVAVAGGAVLSVVRAGDLDRPVVVAVHGFASSARTNWIATGWQRALNEAGLTLIAFDLRGHGASSLGGAALGLEALADDALAVLESFGVEQAHWLGYSLGSRVGIEAAHRDPGRWSTLVLGGIPGSDPTSGRLRSLAADAGLLDAHLDAIAGDLGPGGTPTPAPPRGLRTLVVVGDADEVAHDAADWAVARGLPATILPGRTHLNAVSARGFKEAAITFMTGEPRGERPDSGQSGKSREA